MKMKTEHHRYGFRAEYIRSIAQIMGIFFFGLGIFALFTGCLSLTELADYDFSAFSGSLGYFSLFSLFIPFCCIFAYHLYSDIDVDERGVHIRFFRKILDVDWTDILEVRPVKPKLWTSFIVTIIERRFLVITNSRLTIFHRLYGLVFGHTVLSSFLVSNLISESPDLLQKLIVKSNSSDIANP